MKIRNYLGVLVSLTLVITATEMIQLPNAEADPIPSAPVTQRQPLSYTEALASPDWIAIPGGLVYKSCLHEVPDGSDVSADGIVTMNKTVVDVFPTCPYSGIVQDPGMASAALAANDPAAIEFAPDYGGPTVINPPAGSSIAQEKTTPTGWLLASWWTATVEITKLSAQWTVPANPASNGALVYLFPSVEPSGSGGAIIQPVLQWGNNGAFGGNAWVMANWYVPSSGNASYSSPQTTPVGSVIIGTMTRTSSTTGTWSIGFTNKSAGTSKTLSINTGKTSWKAVQGGVLEAYSVGTCQKLPKVTSLTFGSISVSSSSGTVTPSFVGYKWVTTCGVSISVTSTSTKLGWNPS